MAKNANLLGPAPKHRHLHQQVYWRYFPLSRTSFKPFSFTNACMNSGHITMPPTSPRVVRDLYEAYVTSHHPAVRYSSTLFIKHVIHLGSSPHICEAATSLNKARSTVDPRNNRPTTVNLQLSNSRSGRTTVAATSALSATAYYYKSLLTPRQKVWVIYCATGSRVPPSMLYCY
jgi:hypothetical protein